MSIIHICCNRPRYQDFTRLSGCQDNADACGDRTRNQSRHRFPYSLLARSNICLLYTYVATDLDIRTLPGYQVAKTTRTLAVTEPAINPDTGFPILSLRVPIYVYYTHMLQPTSISGLYPAIRLPRQRGRLR